ncbi:MAG: hypothetical protein U1F98_07925 [Verrucomicrobiota bacterium]
MRLNLPRRKTWKKSGVLPIRRGHCRLQPRLHFKWVEDAQQAGSLYERWDVKNPAEKREMVELITDKITVAKTKSK